MRKILFSTLLLMFTTCWSFGQIVLNEDFSSGTLPTGWTQTTASNDTWFFGGSVDFGSSFTRPDADGNNGEYARIDYSTDPDTTALVTPALSISGVPSPEMSFFYNSQTTNTSFSPYNRLIVDYWNGTAWQNITIIDTLTTAGWTKYTFNATLYTYATDSVRFRYAAQEGGAAAGGTGTQTYDQDCMIDNIYIGPPCNTAFTVSGTDASCGGTATASATVVTSGGTAPFSYVWSNGLTTASITGVMAGTYGVTVTDATGCPKTGSVTLSEPSAVIATTMVDSNQTCVSNGAISVTVTGGTTPYAYLWSTGDTSSSIGNLIGGTYTVTVTDANGCTSSSSSSITPYVTMQNFWTTVDPSCSGPGSITMDSITGGTPILHPCGDGSAYTCDGAVQTTTFGTGTSTNSSTGYPSPYGNWYWGARHQIMYRKSELNAMGIVGPTNMSSIAFDVADLSTSTLNYLNYEIKMGCTADSTLAAWQTNINTIVYTADTVVVDTGWNMHSFSTPFFWNGEDNIVLQICFNNSGFTRNVLAPYTSTGYTSVRYYRADISTVCSNTTSTTGTSANRPNARFTHCSVTPQPFVYNWSNGATTASLSGLTMGGTYTVTISDNYGCTITDSVTLASPNLNIATTTTDATCNGAADGSASATASGGVSPFTYLWSDGQTTSTATGLLAGTYTVTATDNGGCTSTGSVTITEPTAIVATVTSTNTTCNGACDGSATVSVSGGTPAYTYVWSNGTTTANPSGLCAGNYSVTITDANGCTSVENITITEPTLLVASTTVDDDVSCNGLSDGEATASATGGTTPYSYAWSSGGTGATETGLAAGNYSVTVTDANGCTATDMVSIAEPTVLMGTISQVNDASCNGFNDGSAVAAGSGGTAPYSYAWSNSTADSNLTGVAAGTYHLTVTDDNGCMYMDSVTIGEPTAVVVSIATDNDVSCNGLSDGSLTASATGGAGSYTYQWSSGAATATASGLAFGTYSVTVTDADGCTGTASAGINQPDVLTSTISLDSLASCSNENDGGASVSVNGGTTPYAYAWSDGSTNMALTNVGAGVYSVTITDANGCTNTHNITVGFINSPTSYTQPLQTLCKGESVTVGTSVYTQTGTYTDVFVGSNGCDSTVTTIVIVDSVDVSTSVDTAQTSYTLMSTNDNAVEYQWIDCDNNTAIDGATGQSFTPTANGNYAVAVTEGFCTDTSACIQITNVGIEDNRVDFGVKVYPNPTVDEVNVFIGDHAGMNLIIRDITGKVVFNRLNIETRLLNIDISAFNSGVYFLEFENDNKRQVERLIVL